MHQTMKRNENCTRGALEFGAAPCTRPKSERAPGSSSAILPSSVDWQVESAGAACSPEGSRGVSPGSFSIFDPIMRSPKGENTGIFKHLEKMVYVGQCPQCPASYTPLEEYFKYFIYFARTNEIFSF